jgi:hypothetical protein
VPHAVYARHLTVRSEVYYPVLEPKIRGAFAIIRRHLKLPAPA